MQYAIHVRVVRSKYNWNKKIIMSIYDIYSTTPNLTFLFF